MIFLNIQENANGFCKYCVYVSVWSLDMVEANFFQCLQNSCLMYWLFFHDWSSFFPLSTICCCFFFDSYHYPNVSFIVFPCLLYIIFVTIKCVVVYTKFGSVYIFVENSFKCFEIDFPRAINVNRC